MQIGVFPQPERNICVCMCVFYARGVGLSC